MFRPPALAAALSLAAAAAGQPPTVHDLSAVERQTEHFYGAIAGPTPPAVRWEVDPPTAPLGRPFTLTLVVTGAANPRELTRPPLADRPEFRELFTAVEDLPDAAATGPDVRFVYRVTPRAEGSFRIPELTFRYHQPRAQPGRRMQTVFADPAPFTVTPPLVPVVPPVPLDAPPAFFERRAIDIFDRSGGPGAGWWAGLFAVAAGGVAVWVVVWRVLFPNAARQAALRRNWAVRTALERLRTPHLRPAGVAVTVRNYLMARWGLAYTAQTPEEVAAGLSAVGLSADRATEAAELLRECDAARFGGAAVDGVTERAAAMIERWEEG